MSVRVPISSRAGDAHCIGWQAPALYSLQLKATRHISYSHASSAYHHAIRLKVYYYGPEGHELGPSEMPIWFSCT